MIPKGKIAYTNLKPLDILVMGDIAVLHYYLPTRQTIDGKETEEQGRWTDVWKKEGGKWLLIADSGGVLPQNRKALKRDLAILCGLGLYKDVVTHPQSYASYAVPVRPYDSCSPASFRFPVTRNTLAAY